MEKLYLFSIKRMASFVLENDGKLALDCANGTANSWDWVLMRMLNAWDKCACVECDELTATLTELQIWVDNAKELYWVNRPYGEAVTLAKRIVEICRDLMGELRHD